MNYELEQVDHELIDSFDDECFNRKGWMAVSTLFRVRRPTVLRLSYRSCSQFTSLSPCVRRVDNIAARNEFR